MPKRSSATPIRRQYLDLKRRYPEAILFFRLGDFYETFDDDARIASEELDVVLTSRNVAKGERVPMAGVPHHAAEGYIARLIAKGYKVAVCEQVSDKPINGLMPREVVRVVTPGTVVSPELLAEKRNNYLAALVIDKDHAGIAYVDITTGDFGTTQIDSRSVEDDVARELDRLGVAELIVSDGGDAFAAHGEAQSKEALQRYPFLSSLSAICTLYEDWRFEQSNCRQALLAHFRATTLAGYGCDDLPYAVRSAGVLIQYLAQNQPSALTQLTHLSTYSVSSFMTLDMATRRSLELTRRMRDGHVEGTLLWVLDQTLTPMGGRLLRRWIGQPLLDLAALEQRLSAVDVCFQDLASRTGLRQGLYQLGDLERTANRVVQGIAGPRDLTSLKNALQRIADILPRIVDLISATAIRGVDLIYPFDGQDLDPCPAVIDLIARAVEDEAPATLAKGGVIKAGYSAELDAINDSVADAKQWVAGLEARERQRLGIKGLKVGYNKVFGYYIEVTRANAGAVPEDYVRKQTLVNAERYITPELKDREMRILTAAERTQEIEVAIFGDLVKTVAESAAQILGTARAIAHLDVYLALAHVAALNNYVRPQLENGQSIEIHQARHPIVEQTLPEKLFVPNDVHLTEEGSIHIITGPNMSGKSTFLRQVALIALMAQIGSFVPAARAKLGLVDRIFARVGAQDEISAGQSTFMVEMVELANILNHATGRSLLILDEIGRGTSTYDGISIAWAVVEYLHETQGLQPKTLFATHYHELTELDKLFDHIRNYNVAVVNQGDQVVFTHHIVQGGADRSYGIHVAQMAGMPERVTNRATEILGELESAAQRVPVQARHKIIEVRQLGLFQREDPLVGQLRALDVENMSPIEALNALYALRREVDSRG